MDGAPARSTPKDYAGRTWQDAAQTLVQKKAGMYLLGMFVSAAVRGDEGPGRPRRPRLLPVPDLGTEFDAEKALDAPIDAFMIAPSRRTSRPSWTPPRPTSSIWAKGRPRSPWSRTSRALIPTANDADTSTYTPLQKKAAEIIGEAQRITQFLDRDTRSDFAGANGMQAFLQTSSPNPTRTWPPTRRPSRTSGTRSRRSIRAVASLTP